MTAWLLWRAWKRFVTKNYWHSIRWRSASRSTCSPTISAPCFWRAVLASAKEMESSVCSVCRNCQSVQKHWGVFSIPSAIHWTKARRLLRNTVLPLFRPAPEIIQRQSVRTTLWTGVMAVDAAIPIGRGQRELIIGDRNVGKTALAIDFVAAQRPGDVACVYVMIGQPMSRVRALRDTLERVGCLTNTAIIAAYASDSPGLQYLAPLAGASLAESFRDAGGDALVVYDDLTKHADAYRELAPVLDRPPGREAYPGDIFYLHAELLERAAALSSDQGGGSVTAFPLVETTDGDISAYIPTNLISITDGQIYLDTGRFERDLRPAIDIGRSVSRIGAVAQPPPMRKAAKNLKIQMSRFESLEKLSRVGLDIDVTTQTTLQEGAYPAGPVTTETLSPRTIAQQVLMLTAVSEHWLSQLKPWQAVLAAEALVELAEVSKFPKSSRRSIAVKCRRQTGSRQSRN